MEHHPGNGSSEFSLSGLMRLVRDSLRGAAPQVAAEEEDVAHQINADGEEGEAAGKASGSEDSDEQETVNSSSMPSIADYEDSLLSKLAMVLLLSSAVGDSEDESASNPLNVEGGESVNETRSEHLRTSRPLLAHSVEPVALFEWKDGLHRGLKCNEEATDALSMHSSLLNFMCVIGPTGHGKSFLQTIIASVLLQSTSVPRFKSSLQNLFTTTGVEMYPLSIPMEMVLECVSSMDTDSESSNNQVMHACNVQEEAADLILLDVEGTGHEDMVSMAKLLLPTMMISSVVLYRVINRPGMADILKRLSDLAELASWNLGPGSSNHPTFGHLFIVCGDNKLSAEECKQLSQFLLESEMIEQNTSDAVNTAVQARNHQRNQIRLAFPSVHVHCLPFPVRGTMLTEDCIPIESVSPEYLRSVRSLLEKCSIHFNGKLNFAGGCPLNGTTACQTIQFLVKEFDRLDSLGSLSMVSLVSNIESKRANREAIASCILQADRLKGQFPTDPVLLKSQLDQIVRETQDELTSRLHGIPGLSEEALVSCQRTFIESADSMKTDMLSRNEQHVKEFCSNLVRQESMTFLSAAHDSTSGYVSLAEVKRQVVRSVLKHLPSYIDMTITSELLETIDQFVSSRYTLLSENEMSAELFAIAERFQQNGPSMLECMLRMRSLCVHIKRGAVIDLLKWSHIISIICDGVFGKFADELLFEVYQRQPAVLSDSTSTILRIARFVDSTGNTAKASEMIIEALEGAKARNEDGREFVETLLTCTARWISIGDVDHAMDFITEASNYRIHVPLQQIMHAVILQRQGDDQSAKALRHSSFQAVLDGLQSAGQDGGNAETRRAEGVLECKLVVRAALQGEIVDTDDLMFLDAFDAVLSDNTDFVLQTFQYCIKILQDFDFPARFVDRLTTTIIPDLRPAQKDEVCQYLSKFYLQKGDSDQAVLYARMAYNVTRSTRALQNLCITLAECGNQLEAFHLMMEGVTSSMPSETSLISSRRDEQQGRRDSARRTEDEDETQSQPALPQDVASSGNSLLMDALLVAIYNGDDTTITSYVQRGGDVNLRVNAMNDSPLLLVSLMAHQKKICLELLKHPNIDVSLQDNSGLVAIDCFATRSNDVEVLQKFLSAGAIPTTKTLIIALDSCRLEIASILLDHPGVLSDETGMNSFSEHQREMLRCIGTHDSLFSTQRARSLSTVDDRDVHPCSIFLKYLLRYPDVVHPERENEEFQHLKKMSVQLAEQSIRSRLLISDEVREAWAVHTCSRCTTKSKDLKQLIFHCRTCDLVDRYGCCLLCAFRCHFNQGHAISLIPYYAESFFCDCRDRATCACNDDVEEDDAHSE
eukprot:ANDGO_00590.mRNA.1 hypothetical protein